MGRCPTEALPTSVLSSLVFNCVPPRDVSTDSCSLSWKQGICRYDRVERRPSECALTHRADISVPTAEGTWTQTHTGSGEDPGGGRS